MEEFFKVHPEKRASTNAKPVLCTLDMSHLDLKMPFSGSVEFLVYEDGKVETNIQSPIR